MKYNDPKYVGMRSGYLTVQSYKHGKFVCKCDCGYICECEPWYIANEIKKSCSRKECDYFHKLMIEKSQTHGQTGKRLYTIWNNMIARCHHPQNPNYKNYGGRGICVCEEWRNNLNEFTEWSIKNGYKDNLTIDRIDNNGNYEPSNCRWVSYSVQMHNQRKRTPFKHKCKNIWTIDGITKDGVDWCVEYNISYPTVLYRINKMGLSPKDALTIKSKPNGRKRKVDVYGNKGTN